MWAKWDIAVNTIYKSEYWTLYRIFYIKGAGEKIKIDYSYWYNLVLEGFFFYLFFSSN